jgi:probable F420-dependent oxidoreductase
MTTIDDTFGVYTFDFEHQPAALVRESAHELEELGWRTFWFPEVGGREAFSQAAFLLSNTERLTVVNGIAQVTARSARATHGAGTMLAQAYPGRHLLGLGIGQGRPGSKPLTVMSEYLDELDTFDEPVPRILAAYGPKMLAMARDRADGAHTYHVTVPHTAHARELLGSGAFLGVEQAVLFETDPDKARATARAHLHPYVTTPFNIAKFRRLGYSEDDLANGGSDRFVDDLGFWGDLDTIVAKLRGHVDAGADHVAVQVVGIPPGESAMPRWRALAGALVPAAVGR